MPASSRRGFIRDVASIVAAGAAVACGGPSVMQTSSPRALVFDAYGTLFDVFSVTALCEQLFPGNGAALATLWRAKQLQYSLLRSMMNRYKDFWQLTQDGLAYAAQSLKLDLTAEKRDRLMDAYLVLSAFPDVAPGLRQLKARGLKLAILSNGEPKMLQSASSHAGIAELLDVVISVDEIKIFKPDPRVYALAASRLGLPAADIGFVSSNNWDINGAGSAGLTTFWIQRAAAEPPEQLDNPAGHVVHAITDLAALVG
jgi:2-haloacid dehalogenase